MINSKCTLRSTDQATVESSDLAEILKISQLWPCSFPPALPPGVPSPNLPVRIGDRDQVEKREIRLSPRLFSMEEQDSSPCYNSGNMAPTLFRTQLPDPFRSLP